MMAHVQYSYYISINKHRPQYFNIMIDLNSEPWGCSAAVIYSYSLLLRLKYDTLIIIILSITKRDVLLNCRRVFEGYVYIL